MSKYICNECNCGFVEPKAVIIDEFYGIVREFNYPSDGFVDLCPYCESNDIVEQIDIYDLMEEGD